MKRIAAALLMFSAALSYGQNLSYKNFPSDAPERKTEYYAWTKVHGGVKLVIEATFKSEFWCRVDDNFRVIEGHTLTREYVGTLTQADGKVIAFLPKDPADKIIDRDLIGWVIFVSNQALTEDKQYLNTANEYTDETGQRWIKVVAPKR